MGQCCCCHGYHCLGPFWWRSRGPGKKYEMRQTNRQIDKQTDRQTDRQRGRQTGLGSLTQLVERQHIKLRVMVSSPAGVHFFFHFLSITHMIPQ